MSVIVEKQPANSILNVPNQVTALRLVLAVVVFVLIAAKQHFVAMACFSLAAGTDWVDGYWARRYGQVTQFGRIFDPFVDKIIICGVFIFLVAEPGSKIAPWMAVLVVGRELLVTALRGVVEQTGKDFSANWSGKWKMFLQCIAAAGSLLLLAYRASPPAWLSHTVPVTIWLAVATTLYSGIIYVNAAARALRG